MYRQLELKYQRHQSRSADSSRACSHSQCSDPAMIVFCWQCIQQN